MKFENIGWKEQPLKFELENSSIIITRVKNLTNGAFNCIENYAIENDFKGRIIVKKASMWDKLEVEFKGDSAWLYSQSSGIFVERLG